MHPLERQIAALEMISDRPVVAITLNHEGLDPAAIPEICGAIGEENGLPVFDVLREGAGGLASVVVSHIAKVREAREEGR